MSSSDSVEYRDVSGCQDACVKCATVAFDRWTVIDDFRSKKSKNSGEYRNSHIKLPDNTRRTVAPHSLLTAPASAFLKTKRPVVL